ncbi:hypothetical protein ACPCGN_26220 [Methylobacterium sp. NPDC014790]|uniref:hypothetical protein n=1 Tax=Methylobacterium sp. NPDC014790 TaxID=3364153 RepID=UPI003C2B3461
MSVDRTQTPQQPQAPAPRPETQTQPRGDFARKSFLAAIGGACSGAARAVVAHFLRE